MSTFARYLALVVAIGFLALTPAWAYADPSYPPIAVDRGVTQSTGFAAWAGDAGAAPSSGSNAGGGGSGSGESGPYSPIAVSTGLTSDPTFGNWATQAWEVIATFVGIRR